MSYDMKCCHTGAQVSRVRKFPYVHMIRFILEIVLLPVPSQWHYKLSAEIVERMFAFYNIWFSDIPTVARYVELCQALKMYILNSTLAVMISIPCL